MKISKKRGCLGIFILFIILFIILVVIVSNEETELADKISVLAKNPENLDSLQKYCLQYRKTFSKVLENCNEALAPIIVAEEAAKEQTRIEQAKKDSLAKEAMEQAKREQAQKDSLATEQAKRDSLIELARKDSLAMEQIKRDSLAIEQEKRDSILREVNYEYKVRFRDYDGRNFNSLYCKEEDLARIKFLVKQGATVISTDTLVVARVLDELQENKKNMTAELQTIRKIARESGENIERLERAFNITSKEINENIKNCKEIKKVLVTNLGKD